MSNKYQPKPISTEGITLAPDLMHLAELLAKQVHEVWAEERMAQGWVYGPHRNDMLKENPCLMEYEFLPESEKVFDRRTSQETLKLIIKLGFRISKEKD